MTKRVTKSWVPVAVLAVFCGIGQLAGEPLAVPVKK
jgi:hypothetical protein